MKFKLWLKRSTWSSISKSITQRSWPDDELGMGSFEIVNRHRRHAHKECISCYLQNIRYVNRYRRNKQNVFWREELESLIQLNCIFLIYTCVKIDKHLCQVRCASCFYYYNWKSKVKLNYWDIGYKMKSTTELHGSSCDTIWHYLTFLKQRSKRGSEQ